ncbi:MAG: ATP synthase subunit C [Synergistales bacterium]|nr:ATP synthase subunit C [Synergistales bacterium]
MLWITALTAGGLIVAGALLRGRRTGRPRRILRCAVGGVLLALVMIAALPFLAGPSLAGETAAASPSGLAFLGASLSTGLACLGAGIAVAVVGAAALGVIGEKPEALGMTLIYLGLAEGIAIYGVIISLLILARL